MRTQFYATDKQQEMIEKLYPADTDQHWLIVGQSVSLKPYVELRFRRFVGLPARIIYNAVRLAHWLEGKYSEGENHE